MVGSTTLAGILYFIESNFSAKSISYLFFSFFNGAF